MTQHKNLEQTYDSFPIYMHFKYGLFVEIYFRFDIFCAALCPTRNNLIRGQGFFDNLSRGYYGHNKYAFRFSLHSLGRKEYLLKIGPTLKAWFETIWHILIILIDAYCIIVIVSSVHIVIHSQFSHSCLGEEKVIYDFCCHCHYIPIWGNPKPRAIISLRNKRFDKISLMES